jgi:hypothetical protein
MDLLAAFMSGANLWAQKMPNFVDWTDNRLSAGVEYVVNHLLQHCKYGDNI